MLRFRFYREKELRLSLFYIILVYLGNKNVIDKKDVTHLVPKIVLNKV